MKSLQPKKKKKKNPNWAKDSLAPVASSHQPISLIRIVANLQYVSLTNPSSYVNDNVFEFLNLTHH